MKKYLKCIKKLPLAKSILVGSIFLICSSSALAWLSFGDKDYNYTGIVSNVSFQKSGTTCSITVNQNPAITSDKKQICDFANKAKDFNRKVSLHIHQIRHFVGSDGSYHVSGISFANTKAHEPSGKKENFRFDYMLQGKVEDVQYTEDNKCYIAINGPNIRNNLDRHYTAKMEICKLAENAFYTGMQVRMIATVDNASEGNANDINSFNVTQCCTRSQRN
ncbi:Conserved hypothetical protein [Bacteriophage APSE-7]|nr:Conserved hypothetical protein [Bacteriophage APSE-7]